MALTVWSLNTEMKEYLEISNLTKSGQYDYVNKVKQTIIGVIWNEKLSDESAIITNEEISEIKEKVSDLEKPVWDAINEFLFYFDLILRIEEKSETENNQAEYA